MTAVARDLDHSLVSRIAAMIAAIFVIAAYRASTAIMFASVIVVCH